MACLCNLTVHESIHVWHTCLVHMSGMCVDVSSADTVVSAASHEVCGIGRCVDMCMNMSIDMCTDMHADMRTGMRTDMCINMCVDMC